MYPIKISDYVTTVIVERDLLDLRAHGQWLDGKVPAWADALADFYRVGAGSNTIIMAGMEYLLGWRD